MEKHVKWQTKLLDQPDIPLWKERKGKECNPYVVCVYIFFRTKKRHYRSSDTFIHQGERDLLYKRAGIRKKIAGKRDLYLHKKLDSDGSA